MKVGELSKVLSFYEDFDKEWDEAYQQVGLCDKKTSDFLHDLELVELTKKERNELVEEQIKNLKERRNLKDALEIMSPLRRHMATSISKQNQKALAKVLSEVNCVLGKQENRSYRRRYTEEKGSE